MLLRYDPEADALYVELREHEGTVRTEQLDDYRLVDYDEAGAVVGVELLFASQGIELDDVPEAGRIRDALRSLGRLAAV